MQQRIAKMELAEQRYQQQQQQFSTPRRTHCADDNNNNKNDVNNNDTSLAYKVARCLLPAMYSHCPSLLSSKDVD